MIGRSALVLLVIVFAPVALSGCSAERERQWAKPGADYTIAEFTRDRDACTKKGALDEPCMKERGWIPMTGDREQRDTPVPSSKAGVGPRGPRY